jgi:hypothetical protein
MKAYWGSGGSSTHSLTSALDGSEWSASRPSRFTPRERAPGTHRIGGWVGSRAIQDAVVKRIIPSFDICTGHKQKTLFTRPSVKQSGYSPDRLFFNNKLAGGVPLPPPPGLYDAEKNIAVTKLMKHRPS